MCVNCKWRDLQFNVDSERQIFEKLFHERFIYSQSFCQKSAERKSPKKYFSYFFFDDWPRIRKQAFASKKTTAKTMMPYLKRLTKNSETKHCEFFPADLESRYAVRYSPIILQIYRLRKSTKCYTTKSASASFNKLQRCYTTNSNFMCYPNFCAFAEFSSRHEPTGFQPYVNILAGRHWRKHENNAK